MASEWRLITDDGVSASFGLAADETLACRIGNGEPIPTLRLYTYASTCALVGRFQNVENEIHLDFCREHGIAVNRRPTGGGAIIMGADQLGVALTLPGRGEDTYSHARELMEKFSEGIVRSLSDMGITARFRRKNDIEVKGKKIVGLGIYRAPSDGLLFHASLLVDIDVEFMLHVLNTPFEKISDKEITAVAGRTTTVRRELGSRLTLDAVRQQVAKGYAQAFGVTLISGAFAPAELEATHNLEKNKYRTEEWVYQTTAVPDASGSAKLKTPAGLIDVNVTLAGTVLKAVYIRGDYYASEDAVAQLEASLRWHSAEPANVAATLAIAYTRCQDQLNQLPLADLVQAVQTAIQRAAIIESKSRADPYGCFVNPGGGS